MEQGVGMDKAVLEKIDEEVQELTLAELAQVAGGWGEASFV